jgi:hypothetical protein
MKKQLLSSWLVDRTTHLSSMLVRGFNGEALPTFTPGLVKGFLPR